MNINVPRVNRWLSLDSDVENVNGSAVRELKPLEVTVRVWPCVIGLHFAVTVGNGSAFGTERLFIAVLEGGFRPGSGASEMPGMETSFRNLSTSRSRSSACHCRPD